ncbi:MAG: 50S ribosomal protein L10, partial [Planctomycetota bacterium]
MSRRVKQYMVQEMAERFSDLEDCGCVLVHYQGLGANEAAEVRGKLNEQNADMMVIRNNLFKIALEEL